MIKEAKSYIAQFFTDQRYVYHSMEHTMSVFDASAKIAAKEKVDGEKLELLLLAALFHDTGFAENPKNHESLSANNAERFLKDNGYKDDDITVVKNTILATNVDAEPSNKLEAIIKDADMAHLGQTCFKENTKKLREENEKSSKKKIDSEDWINQNVKFLSRHNWYTKSAKKLFNNRKKKNLLEEKERLKEFRKDNKKKSTEKGVETMYRVALRNHNQLSKIADNKANILLSITAIMLSLVISNLATKIDSHPQFLIPTILLIVVNIVTMFFSILATRPKVSSAPYSRENFLSNKVNILFFGNFYKMSIEEFEWGMNHLQGDRDLLYNSLSKDLYYLGSVLAKKYKYLQIAYAVFMGGLSIAALAFVWTIMK